MAETETAAIVLVDEPVDGYCETQGWVEATVSEDEARDQLAEFCCDEDGNTPCRPTGPAQRVWLACVNPDDRVDEQRWKAAPADSPGAREFWEVIVA